MCKLNIEQFNDKFGPIHNFKYDYSKVIYKGNKKKVIIICPIHGEFLQKPNEHLYYGCRKCADDYTRIIRTKSIENFIKEANQIHNNKYDYSKVEYKTALKKVIIICTLHGEFMQTPANHLNNVGCPVCKFSKGELTIGNWLKNNHINFITQKRFVDCRNKNSLPFDFYLPEHNTCVEFDGRQHFEVVKWSNDEAKNIESFNRVKENDKLKDEYCKHNNIHLIRIPYTQINQIDKILYEGVLNP